MKAKEYLIFIVSIVLLLYVLGNIGVAPTYWLPFAEFLPPYFQQTPPVVWLGELLGVIPFFILVILLFYILKQWRVLS